MCIRDSFVNITVYDVAPKVLPMFDQKLAQYAMDMFKREHIHVKTEHHLTRIRPDEDCAGCLKLRFKEYGEDEVGAGIVVWSTGLMQNPLIQKLASKAVEDRAPSDTGGKAMQLQKDAKTGGLVADAHLRVMAVSQATAGNTEQKEADVAVVPDVFSIGDCAVVAGQRYPATAQVASQQATYLAKSLNKGTLEAKPFQFRNWGVMTYLGSWRAIHQSGTDELTGRAAWFLWRTAVSEVLRSPFSDFAPESPPRGASELLSVEYLTNPMCCYSTSPRA